MKRLVSIVMIAVLTFSLCAFFTPIKAHAEALPVGEEFETVIVNIFDKTTQTVTSSETTMGELIDIVKYKEEHGLIDEIQSITVNNSTYNFNAISLNAWKYGIGSLVLYYNFSQGMTWLANSSAQNRQDTALAIGNSALDTHNSWSADMKKSVGSMLVNMIRDTLYYESYGLPVGSSVFNTIASMVLDYVSPIQIQASGVAFNEYLMSRLSLMTTAQFSDIFSNNLVYGFQSGNYTYTLPISTPTRPFDALLYTTDDGYIRPYNTQTGNYATGSITTKDGYRINTGNTYWTTAAGCTLNFVMQATPQQVFDSGVYLVRQIVTAPNLQTLGNIVPAGVTVNPALDTSGFEATETLPDGITQSVPIEWIENGDTPALDDTAPLPEPPETINPNKWFPIDAFSSIWKYVVALVNAGKGFFGLVGDVISTIPDSIMYPIYGSFVLALFGGILFKLLK